MRPAAVCCSEAAAADKVSEGGLGPPSAAVSKSRRPKRVECVVCLDARAEVMLLPCKHTILCQACAELVRAGGKPCPMCRTEVEGEVLVAGWVGGGGRQGAAVPGTVVGASAAAVEGDVRVAVGGGGPRRTAVPAVPIGAQVDSSSSSSTRAHPAPQAAAAVAIADVPRRQQPEGVQASRSLSCGIVEGSAAAGSASSSNSRVLPLPKAEADTVTPACSSSSSTEATGSNLGPEARTAAGQAAAARVAVAAATSSSSMAMVSGNHVPHQQQPAAGGMSPLLEGTSYGGTRLGSTAAAASDAAGDAASIATWLHGVAATVGGDSTGAVAGAVGLVKWDADRSGGEGEPLQQPPHAAVPPMNPRQACDGYGPETCQAFLGEMAGLLRDSEALGSSYIDQAEGQLDHLQLQVDQLLNHARVQLGQSRMELMRVLEEHKFRMRALCQKYGMPEEMI